MSLFDGIKEASEKVVESMSWVKVDMDALLMYPERLDLSTAELLNHSPEEHLLGCGDDTLRYFILLDAINFGSGYFPYMDKGEGLSGYFTVASRLKSHLESAGIPSSLELSQISADTCARIFEQPLNNAHASELMKLFSYAWRCLGEWVTTNFDGDYLGFLRGSKTAEEAIGALVTMKPFQDVALYFGDVIPFYKRAQILLQDMDLAEPSHPLLTFPDLDDMTVFADNVLPYVLRMDKIIQLHPWLESRIENEELIANGSPEEVELRACAVHFSELIAATIRSDLKSISTRRLDFVLWNRGQQLKKLHSGKRHRCRCIFY
ncbi:queuosine salvage family protein [Sphingomonas sp. LB-2]|uniref:queuosine salvage family protein n=1 Tax=Sphingomonas caeni TaxID=2984949 RepID=UPI00222EF6A6|nr:queuosine salvage family protein [Sphingomonas caeni]MCW3848856.1 queuosine salvage family protein [Sphingomonas caeni]